MHHRFEHPLEAAVVHLADSVKAEEHTAERAVWAVAAHAHRLGVVAIMVPEDDVTHSVPSTSMSRAMAASRAIVDARSAKTCRIAALRAAGVTSAMTACSDGAAAGESPQVARSPAFSPLLWSARIASSPIAWWSWRSPSTHADSGQRTGSPPAPSSYTPAMRSSASWSAESPRTSKVLRAL